MIQIYADGVLTYDSRLEEYDLQGLRITTSLNKGGVAEIVLPPYHPHYNKYIGYKTIVEIYRDGRLRFRGRALYPVDDYNNTRTVVCEGELCFLQDGISRPYLYQTTPQAIFEDVVAKFNAQVDSFKRFKIGSVTVTDPNDYVRLESEEAETVLATINKLVDRCGGFIVFTTDDTGARVINWLATVGKTNRQTIEAGENLFDFSSTGANTDLATALVPYGAKQSNGKRLTIESVNNGLDYITDDSAVALRGTIAKTVTWDDVTEPQNLLTKARQYLNENKLFITSLTLSALDLSYIDKTIESFNLGDYIRVVSNTHGVDEDFQLTEITEDLLNPAGNLITMGKEHRTLTGLDVAGDNKGQSNLEKTAIEIKKDFEVNVQQTIEKALESEETAEKITSIIEQQAGNITLSVSGSLGSKANITLTTAGGAQTSELDLTAIRQAFANDTSAVEIAGGTITFSSNTLIVNSTNFKVSEDGTITATNATLSGTATTENGLHKSELSGGRLRFFYDGTEYGGIASDYVAGKEDVRGVTVRLNTDASYMGFSRINAEGDGYNMWYCINFGANINNHTERHLFFGTSYFSESMTVAGAATFSSSLSVSGASAFTGTATFYGATQHQGNAFFANGKGVALLQTDGSSVFALSISTSNKVIVGSESAPLVVYGSETQLGYSITPTSIAGLKITISGATTTVYGATATVYGQTVMTYGTAISQLGITDSPTIISGQSVSVYGETTFTANTYVQNLIMANSKGFIGYTTAGVKVWMLYIDDQDDVLVGNTIQPTRLRGSTIYTSGSVLFPNGTGIRISDTAGTSQWVLWLSNSNYVNLGVDSYVTYLRGSAVYLASSGAAVTSDERKKNSIEALPEAYEAMLDKLTPVRYKYNNGTSGRYHAGFRAQEVKEALEAVGLTTQDFGGFVDLNGDGEELGLIYAEFIAILLQKIKRQEQRIAALEEAKA